MPFTTLRVPPGVFRNGTRLQARGRWYDANLVRWYGGAMQPVGGWQVVEWTSPDIIPATLTSTDFSSVDVGAPADWAARTMLGSGVLTAVVETYGGGSDKRLKLTCVGSFWASGILEWTAIPDASEGQLLFGFALETDNEDSDDNRVGAAVRLDYTSGSPAGDQWVHAQADFEGTTSNYQLRYNRTTDGNVTGIAMGASPLSRTLARDGTKYWMRYSFSDGRVYRAKLWEDGTAEPASWDFDYTATTETETTAEGGVGFLIDRLEPSGTDNDRLYIYNAAWSSDPAVDAIITPAPATTVDEPIVEMFGWRDNDNVPWLALGTPANAYIYSEGLLREITPAGFQPGLVDASEQVEAYGLGAYGAGIYGEGVVGSLIVAEAQSWQFDNFGQLLIGMAHSDGKIYSFTPNGSDPLTVVDASAPTDNVGVVVTGERFLVALGANGDPRSVAWADQESLSVWTPTTENQAGDFPLATSGAILAAQRARAETLIWTTQDIHSMQYIGGSLVYAFSQVGSNCGLLGRRAFTMVDSTRALWMGHNAFFVYDGNTRPLESSVIDYVFSDINRTQASKIFAVTLPEFGEAWWFYCSAASTSVDRYVAYNYVEDHWSIGQLKRTAGLARGTFPYPMMGDENGLFYDHERGTTYIDTDEETELAPYAETGPMSIGEGDQLMVIRQLIPDEKTLGDVQAYLKSRLYPTGAETTSGPYTLANPTSTRVMGRQVALRVEQVSPGWRVGHPRLDVVPAGGR